MTIFTIDSDNNITAFATAEGAAAASTTPFDLFTNQQELAELSGNWPTDRLLATYNSLPGVKPLKSLKDPKTATIKIWERVEKLGQLVASEPEPPKPETAPVAKPKPAGKAKGGAQSSKVKSTKGKASKEPAAKRAPQPKKGGKAQQPSSDVGTPRGGSKRTEVIAMLQRKNSATIVEIMSAMGWQRHTVRGFMAGAMKKAG